MRTPARQFVTALSPTRHTLLLGLLGAYVNAVAYGFIYGLGNQEFELALVNWLRDPSLYPHDPIRGAFARFPTVFWPAVAYLSNWMATEHVVFVFFLLTKLLFFLALARLVTCAMKDWPLAACTIFAVALSPFLNDLTPFGASDILNSVETHTSLAVALLLWVGYLLMEERWISAAILCALTIYLDALFVVYSLFAFVVFAGLDWRARKRQVLLAGVLGAAICLPWLLLSRGVTFPRFPKGYVEALEVFYPFHLTLRGHAPYDLICGTGLLVAAVLMARVAAKTGLPRQPRLETLAAAYFIPVLLGALFGGFFLPPTLARLQLLRADSFLVLYSILLIQLYGAHLLHTSPTRAPGATFFLGASAVLLPLSDLLGLVWVLFLALAFWAYPKSHFDAFCRAMARSQLVRAAALLLLLAGITRAGFAYADWTSTVVILLVLLGGCFFVYPRAREVSSSRLVGVVLGTCVVAFLMVAAGTVPRLSSFLNPTVALKPLEADWRDIQQWAKASTPRDAQFLVPTSPGGFRVFSERSSWGEWKDGQATYLYPPFADEYRRRMEAVGYPWRPKWIGTQAMRENYQRLSWNHLLTVARENHLHYIIQFRDTAYPVAPVFVNRSYAVYRVPQ